MEEIKTKVCVKFRDEDKEYTVDDAIYTLFDIVEKIKNINSLFELKIPTEDITKSISLFQQAKIKVNNFDENIIITKEHTHAVKNLKVVVWRRLAKENKNPCGKSGLCRNEKCIEMYEAADAIEEKYGYSDDKKWDDYYKKYDTEIDQKCIDGGGCKAYDKYNHIRFYNDKMLRSAIEETYLDDLFLNLDLVYKKRTKENGKLIDEQIGVIRIIAMERVLETLKNKQNETGKQ